jgi:peptidoglycan-associated lipoprotein
MNQCLGSVVVGLAAVLAAACARAPVKKEEPAPLGRVAPAAPARVERPPQEPAAPAEEVAMVSVFFDFDSYMLKPEAGLSLQKIATRAKESNRSLRIEGHCDERGTPEYNLALGEGRARSVEQYLERLGVPKDKMSAVSFGSQRPKARGQHEAAWSQNRRGDVKLE